MGILSSSEINHVESIVFFLSEALSAAVEAGDLLQHSPYEMPRVEAGMDCAEIIGKLAGFRRHMDELWNRELMMLTKILRARELAKELRHHVSELKPEIDTFRLATVMATDLRDALMPAKDTAFNGSVQPKDFLEARGYSNIDNGLKAEPLLNYKISGQIDVRLLIDACEALHFSLARNYGVKTPALSPQEDSEQQVFILAEEAGQAEEEPFLLSDWAEIIPESETPHQPQRPLPFINQPVVH
jgi:hypothetical protein